MEENSDQMKKLLQRIPSSINKIELEIARLEAKINKRNAYYELKSKRWKSSIKGSIYYAENNELREQISMCDQAIMVLIKLSTLYDNDGTLLHENILQNE